jgi:hypothetical protein
VPNKIYGLERQEVTTRGILHSYGMRNMTFPPNIIRVIKSRGGDEMGWTCRMHREVKMMIIFYLETLKRRDRLGSLGVYWGIILKIMLNEIWYGLH